MAALDREQHLPETAHGEGHGVDGHEIERPEPEVVPDIARVVTPAGVDQHTAPGVHAAAGERENLVGLKTQVVHAVKHGGKGRQPYGDHNALEIDPVAHVGAAAGHRRGFIEDGVYGLVERVQLRVAPALLEMALDAVQPFA